MTKHHKISTPSTSHEKLSDCILSSSATNIYDRELLYTDDILDNENNQNNCNVITMSELPIVIASNSTYTPPTFQTESMFISYIYACICVYNILILLYICMI